LPRRVAVVTGAGVRLGHAIAWALAQQGYDLVLHCRSSKQEANALAADIRKLGRQAKVLQADLGKGPAVLNFARAAERAFGRVDLLINSAAIFWPTPLERLNEKELDSFLNVNLKGPYLLCSELGRAMKKRGSGAIINMACISGLRAWKNFVPYSISKAGVVSLTQGMAKVLAPEVRVNAIAPGAVLPPEDMTADELKQLRERVPLKKLGSPEEIVKAVLYLSQANFVTGQILCVDGGRSIV
jgi:pteridine reductase